MQSEDTQNLVSCCQRLGLSTSLVQKVQAFVIENYLIIGIFVSVLFAFLYPDIGIIFASWQAGEYKIVSLLNVCLVFLISGFTLKLEELKLVFSFKFQILYSLIMINFITTLLAFGLIRLPYLSPDFAVGLAIFATVPTTLGVGVALTQLAKGDLVFSLFLTVTSNMLGTVTVPFLLGIYLNYISGLKLDPISLLLRLILSVLFPSIVGMACRFCIPNAAMSTKKYKTELSLFSTTNLLMIIWMTLSESRNNLLQQKAGEILYTLIVAIVMHIFYLCINTALVGRFVFKFPLKQAISAIIMCSQKSSPVGLAIITSMNADSSQKGLYAIPCIMGQISQIFIGAFVVKRFSKWVEEDEMATNKAKAMTEAANNLESGESTPETNIEQKASSAVEKIENGVVSPGKLATTTTSSELELVNTSSERI